jgi:hypothetical protein
MREENTSTVLRCEEEVVERFESWVRLGAGYKVKIKCWEMMKRRRRMWEGEEFK